jgi:hypothetical protein
VLWCRMAIAVFVTRVSGQVLGTSFSLLCPYYNNDILFLTLDQDPNGLDFASRHPTCFYGTQPRDSTSNFCVSLDHSCSQTRRDGSESNFREPKELAHDNEMIRPQQTRDENASSFLSTKPTPHTQNFPSRGGQKPLRSVPPTNVKLIYCFYFCPKDIILQSKVLIIGDLQAWTPRSVLTKRGPVQGLYLYLFSDVSKIRPWMLEKESMNIWSGFNCLMIGFHFRVL